MRIRKLLFCVLCMVSLSGVFAQENSGTEIALAAVSEEHRTRLESFQAYRENFFLLFDQGVTGSWNTRIIKQSGRSNFVFEDFLAGLYFTTQTKNLSRLFSFDIPAEMMGRVAAYYPLSHTFNEYPQPPVNMLNFGIDLFLAPVVQVNFLDYVFLDIAAGPHFLYQKSDRWHYVHLGIGGMLGVEMPLARRWTLLLNGMASFDNANLGSNKKMEIYDYAWQYQVSFGFRYSKRAPNTITYLPTKGSDSLDFEALSAEQEKKEAKAQEKAAKKAEKAAEKAQKAAEKEENN